MFLNERDMSTVYLLRTPVTSGAQYPTQDQESFRAKNHSTYQGGIQKIRLDRGKQCGDTEGDGHEKPEGSTYAESPPKILVAAQK